MPFMGPRLLNWFGDEFLDNAISFKLFIWLLFCLCLTFMGPLITLCFPAPGFRGGLLLLQLQDPVPCVPRTGQPLYRRRWGTGTLAHFSTGTLGALGH